MDLWAAQTLGLKTVHNDLLTIRGNAMAHKWMSSNWFGLLLHIQFIQPIPSLDGSRFFRIRFVVNGTNVPIEMTLYMYARGTTYNDEDENDGTHLIFTSLKLAILCILVGAARNEWSLRFGKSQITQEMK